MDWSLKYSWLPRPVAVVAVSFEFFEDAVSGWGQSVRLNAGSRTDNGHPVVAAGQSNGG